MISDVITDLTTGTYTVTRRATGTLALGRYTPAGSTTLPIVAIVQPYGGGRKMLPLPHGVRAEDVRLLHTATPLRTRDDAGEADSVSIGGTPYFVWAVEGPWTLDGDDHYEAYVARRSKP